MEAIRERVTGTVVSPKYGKRDMRNQITYCLVSDDSGDDTVRFFLHRDSAPGNVIPPEGTRIRYNVKPKQRPNDSYDRADDVEILREDAA